MVGALGGVTRLGFSALILSVVLTVAFHWAYPDIQITAGLELEFVVAAVIVVGGVGAAWAAVTRRRKPRPADAVPPTPPPPSGS